MEKIDWVIHFRRAKQTSTLKVMFEGALNKAASLREQADIILAHEVRELEKLYFEKLQEYLNINYGNILKKDLEFKKKNSLTFKNELLILEKKINEIAKTSKGSYTAEDLKELYPTIFAEKEAISSVYTENYKAQKVIENSVAKLDELIVYQSTLNKVEDKMSIRLIFIISNVLGIFLGVFIVFVKEFLKGINWKELKQLSK